MRTGKENGMKADQIEEMLPGYTINGAKQLK